MCSRSVTLSAMTMNPVGCLKVVTTEVVWLCGVEVDSAVL